MVREYWTSKRDPWTDTMLLNPNPPPASAAADNSPRRRRRTRGNTEYDSLYTHYHVRVEGMSPADRPKSVMLHWHRDVIGQSCQSSNCPCA